MMASTFKTKPQEQSLDLAKRYIEGTDYSKLWFDESGEISHMNCGTNFEHMPKYSSPGGTKYSVRRPS